MADSVEIFAQLLQLAVQNRASDIHVKSGKPAYLRIHGALQAVDMEPLSAHQVLQFIEYSCPIPFFDRWQQDNQIDFSYKIDEVGRFRVNCFQQRGQPSIVFRYVKDQPPTFEQLNLDAKIFAKLCSYNDGIMLVCGATGAGKTSTLAAMLNHINYHQDCHIVTLEDPIEYNFSDIKSVFNQREVGIDTPTFATGLRAVLRQDPDVILIGEMRDAETFNTALSAAETGHYVFSTLHASNAQQAIQRLFEFYPPDEHLGLRRQLASSLRGTVTQKLLPRLQGEGMVPAVEVFVVDVLGRTILAEGRFDKIPSVIEAGSEVGSKSFNQDLYRLIKSATISRRVGLSASPNPKALEMNLQGIFLSEGSIVD